MSRMIRVGVYQILNLTNNKCYIGSSANGLDKRWTNHQSLLANSLHHSCKLQRAWNKYGSDIFSFKILEECPPEQCIEREQYYLDTLLFANCNDFRFDRLGYNICRQARSRLGLKLSSEHKTKIRASRQGQKHSEETKIKMSKASIGYRHSAETKIKLSKANRGQCSNNVKLNAEDVRYIRILLQEGHGQQMIAQQFDITQGVVSRIKNRKAWSWL